MIVEHLFWLSVYAVACVVEFLGSWLKQHAEKHIKGEQPKPPEPPK